MECFVCGNKKLTKFLSLGQQPPSDAFLRAADLKKKEAKYPLDLFFCPNCGLVQLGHIVNPKILFTDYVYNSGSNNSLIANFKNLVDSAVKRFKLSAGDFAIDIGSNDGTLLANYLPYKVKILGVDPSSATKLAIERGIPSIVDFFTYKLAKLIKKKYGQAKIITATNVFAHVAKLNDFMRGVKLLLAEDGVFISESGYLLDLISKLQFDSIYHEHLRYYHLKSLRILFNKYGLEIFDVARIGIHGGSVRVYAAKIGKYKIEPSVAELLRLEEKYGLNKFSTFRQFAKKIEMNKLALRKLIIGLKEQGKVIIGIGAPAKGNTLLNYCRLGPKYISYLAEKSRLKIGLFSPGQHLPVVDEKQLFSDQPDYAILLSWNIADELIPKIRKAGFKGKFILPTPRPKIL